MFNKTIYFDVDGVLADFDLKANEIRKKLNIENIDFNKKNNQLTEKEIELKQFFWCELLNYKDFWIELPLMPKAKELYDFCKKNFAHIKILTATPRKYSEEIKQKISKDKKNWILKNIDNKINKNDIITITKIGEKKSFYLTDNPKNCILIDNAEFNIKDWEEKKGIGFLFKNANNTLQEIKEYIKSQN